MTTSPGSTFGAGCSISPMLGEAPKELEDVGSTEDGFAAQIVMSVKMSSRIALGDEAFAAAYAEGLTQD